MANTRIDFLQTNRLDKILQRSLPAAPTNAGPCQHLKLAVLSSSTADHLTPALRVAALRRNLQLETYVGEYGMYRQALQDEASDLFAFQPDALLFAFDAAHLLGATPGPQRAEADETRRHGSPTNPRLLAACA